MTETIILHASTSSPHEETVVVDALPDECPTCGEAMHVGYGLAGGGMGSYALCLHCEDGPLFKTPEPAEES